MRAARSLFAFVMTLALTLLVTLPALAQHTIDFDVSTTTGAGEVTTTVSWSTSPPADSCEATGAPEWAGTKGPSGSQELTLTQSVTLNLLCTWPGDSIATLSWTNPTTNVDGSPYTDPGQTVIRWRMGAGPVAVQLPNNSLADLQSSCAASGVSCVFLDPAFTMHTITGITDVGEFRAAAYACNQRDVCSEPSNVASKTFTGAVTVTESIGITVNPVPSPITGLAVQ